MNWDMVQGLFDRDDAVRLQVSGYNRGGVLVGGDDLHGFVPVSHLIDIACDSDEEERERLLERYVGRTICLKIIECDAERGRVVFSERAALAESGRRNQLFGGLQPGECVRGVVTNITDFGIFVDLGGVEGLIHVSELSWGRVRHPSEVASIGITLTALVLHIDKDRSRIALSLKRIYPNPWNTAEARYHPGQVVDAVITSIVPFGAFARLEEGLDGLIHITEMKSPADAHSAENLINEGQNVRVRVINVDASRQRLGLSLKLEQE
jgi:small subunit ribosomal protein S1